MISFLLGIVVAVGTGTIVEVISSGVTRVIRFLRFRISNRTHISFDVRQDGLFVLTEWSPSRRLEAWRLETRFIDTSHRVPHTWIDSTVLSSAVAIASETNSGEIGYIADIEIDHRESPDTQRCKVAIADSEYSEVRAIEALRISNPDVLEQVDRGLEASAREYVKSAVPSSIAIDIVPVAGTFDLLCAERSSAVDNGIGMWTVGVYETLKRNDPNRPGDVENFFALAARGLQEELGIRIGEFGDIHITWLGIYRPILRGHIVAFVDRKSVV